MAGEVIDLCKERGLKRVSVLGVTYKPDVDDTRESPSTAVIETLRAELGDDAVHVHDPMVDSNAYTYPIETLFNAVADSELIVFLVAHREFRLMDPLAIGEITRNKLVVDYMQCIDAEKWKATGFEVFRMGHVPA